MGLRRWRGGASTQRSGCPEDIRRTGDATAVARARGAERIQAIENLRRVVAKTGTDAKGINRVFRALAAGGVQDYKNSLNQVQAAYDTPNPNLVRITLYDFRSKSVGGFTNFLKSHFDCTFLYSKTCQAQ